MEKIRQIFAQIFLTWLGRFALAAVLIIVGGFMSPYGTIGEYIDYERDTTIWDCLLYIGAATALIQTLIFMVFAGINTVKDFKNRKK